MMKTVFKLILFILLSGFTIESYSQQAVGTGLSILPTIKVTMVEDTVTPIGINPPTKFLIVESTTAFKVHGNDTSFIGGIGTYKFNTQLFESDTMVTIVIFEDENFVPYHEQYKLIVK